MKADIHPKYVDATITCSCGAVYHVRSTKPSYRVEVCGACHPFYTGTQRVVDSGGRVERFRKKYAAYQTGQAAADVADAGQAPDAAEAPAPEESAKDLLRKVAEAKKASGEKKKAPAGRR